jgi:hypothetical protein
MTGSPLLNRQDPNPVQKTLPDTADSPFVLVGDHAGAAIPAVLGDLGMQAADRARHIAVDIGTEALGRELSVRLGAPFVSQAYSRLVVDCNRDPANPEWIVQASDGTPVPGNRGLSEGEREARRAPCRPCRPCRACRRRRLVFRQSRDRRFGGDQQAGDRGRVLQRGAHDLGRVDHAGSRPGSRRRRSGR